MTSKKYGVQQSNSMSLLMFFVDNVINKVIDATNNVVWKKSMIFEAVCLA